MIVIVFLVTVLIVIILYYQSIPTNDPSNIFDYTKSPTNIQLNVDSNYNYSLSWSNPNVFSSQYTITIQPESWIGTPGINTYFTTVVSPTVAWPSSLLFPGISEIPIFFLLKNNRSL